ncbi:transmembrane emp24 domain-containing protein p24beta2 [Lycium barbarum]|uniref:transmembrane emp24 domain-containing protein p24beta2 n=1 Tax=Lycium barbarum TaxID=112863 RepID=UPI00293E18C3|nr:transmembrane emp24 domain-containing protein p24beta2 [Lycium barbarum]
MRYCVMGKHVKCVMILFLLVIFSKGIYGIRFEIDREECLSHNVHLEGDTIHLSFVVIQADTPWHSANDGAVDLMITGPSGEQIHGFRDKTSEKYEFIANRKGLFQFCFTNKSPYHETLDFDVQVVHYTYYDQHAKDEHFDPLLEQISKLEAALYNIQFEQHWLEAQTDRQALLNEGMSQRAITKALLESITLVGVSFLQVFLLQRLFEKKLHTVRV